MIRQLLALIFMVIAVQQAFAVGVLDRETCIYNGKKLNKGIAAETATEIPKLPENFTGTAVCFDIRSKRRTEEVKIKNGKKHGIERRFDRTTGKLSEEINYVNGERHGVMKRYDHRNNGLQQEMQYKQGQIQGVQKTYYSDSGQLERIQWRSKVRSGGKTTEIYFNKDGSLSMLSCGEQVISTQDSKWCGRDGVRSEVVLYADSSNGNSWPREIRHYKNNLLDGEVIKLHREGHMMRKEVYAKGERVSSESFADGKRVHIEKYQDGKQSGEEVAYFEGTEKIKMAVQWKDSKKLKQLEFYQNGKPKEAQLFDGDTVMITRYRQDGSKQLEGAFIERGSAWWPYMISHGAIKIFSDDGHLSEEAGYSYGRLNGQRKLYNSTQDLTREESYEKGSLVSAKDYDRFGQIIREIHYFPDGSVKKSSEPPAGL
jgi:antitoxin component YwqK of YwqJK toxin-antitoxin module